MLGGLPSHATYVCTRDPSRCFTGLAAPDVGTSVAWSTGARHLNTRVQSVKPGYFSAPRVSAASGRRFAPEDERAGAEAMPALREDRLERLGPELGSTFTINTPPFRVVGTLPRDAAALDRQARPTMQRERHG
jgi:hypothetical protein